MRVLFYSEFWCDKKKMNSKTTVPVIINASEYSIKPPCKFFFYSKNDMRDIATKI